MDRMVDLGHDLVAVEVVVAGDLVIRDGVDDVVDDRQPQRLVATSGEAFPGGDFDFLGSDGMALT